MRKTGTVKNFEPERCWGFIAPDDDSDDIFAHVTQIADGQKLQEGDTVTYAQGWNARKAKAWAENITGGNGGPLGKGGGSNSRGSKKSSKARGCNKAESKHKTSLPEGLQATPQQPFTWPLLPPSTKAPLQSQAIMQYLQICSMQAMQLRRMQAMQQLRQMQVDFALSVSGLQSASTVKTPQAALGKKLEAEVDTVTLFLAEQIPKEKTCMDAGLNALEIRNGIAVDAVNATVCTVDATVTDVGAPVGASGTTAVAASATVSTAGAAVDVTRPAEPKVVAPLNNEADEHISLWVTRLNGDKSKISGLLGKSTVRALQAAVAKEFDVDEIHKVSLLLRERVLTEETCMDESLSSLGLAEGAELQYCFLEGRQRCELYRHSEMEDRRSSTAASTYLLARGERERDDAAVGEHLDDPWLRYEPVRELGVGFHGAVWLAIDRQCGNREVAIKRMVRADERKEARIRREAAIMKMLNHPNICKLFDMYLHGRFMYFIMESCTGGELWERINEEGRINEERSRVVFQQVASTLDYAHASGIAHRDLKPENVCFLGAADFVKVIDWGLSSWFAQGHSLPEMAIPLGSGPYQAPEVQEAKADTPYTAACDLWSLGVLLYVMLCGKMPRWAAEGNLHEELQAKKEERFPMDFEAWSTISPEAKDVIKSLLKAEPTERLTIERVLLHPWLTSRPADTAGMMLGASDASVLHI